MPFKKSSLPMLGFTLLFASQLSSAAGQAIIPLNDFTFSATGPMGLGRAAVVDDVNLGYQLVNSDVKISPTVATESTITVDYDVVFTLVDGVLSNSISATANLDLTFDLVISDNDPLFDFYGKPVGEPYTFTNVHVTATLDYVTGSNGVSTFVLNTDGLNVSSDLNGVSLALGVDVNGVDDQLLPITDYTLPGSELFLDVIKFKSNEFLTAFANINLNLAGGTITYDPAPALLSGGVQDAYLDPEFSLLMAPGTTTTTNPDGTTEPATGGSLDNTFDLDIGSWYGIYGGLPAIDSFASTGAGSMLVSRTSASAGVGHDAITLITSGESYTLEADVYLTGVYGTRFLPRIRSHVGTRNIYTILGRENIIPGQWQHVSIPFTAPDVSTATEVELQLQNVLASADFYIDNIQLSGQAPITTTPVETVVVTVEPIVDPVTTDAPVDPSAFAVSNDFEIDFDGWSNAGAVITRDAVGFNSNYSIRSSERGSSMHGLIKSVMGQVAGNTTYILEADVLISGTATSYFISDVKSRIGVKNTYTRIGKQLLQPGWNHIVMEKTLPDLTGATIVDLMFYGVISSTDFSIDNVQIRAK